MSPHMMQLKVHNTFTIPHTIPQEVFLPERVKPGFNQASDVTTTIQEFREMKNMLNNIMRKKETKSRKWDILWNKGTIP